MSKYIKPTHFFISISSLKMYAPNVSEIKLKPIPINAPWECSYHDLHVVCRNCLTSLHLSSINMCYHDSPDLNFINQIKFGCKIC